MKNLNIAEWASQLECCKKFARAFKSITWHIYLMREKNCASITQLLRILEPNDPNLKRVWSFEREKRFLSRKRNGEPIRVAAKIAIYENLVPGSSLRLEHPLFELLGTGFIRHWIYFRTLPEHEIRKLPGSHARILLRLNERLSQPLGSPLKKHIIEQLAGGDTLDSLTSLLILHILCYRQYVRYHFRRKLEKTLFRTVVKLFCKDYSDQWAFDLMRSIQFQLNVLHSIDSPYQQQALTSNKKALYQPIFFNRVHSRRALLSLIRRSKAIHRRKNV